MGKEDHRDYYESADRSGGRRSDRLRAIPETPAGRLRGNVGGRRRRGALAGVRAAVDHRRVRNNNGSGWSDRQRDLCRDARRGLVLGDDLGLRGSAHGLSANGSDLRRVRAVVCFCAGLGMARGAPVSNGFRPWWCAPVRFLALCRVPAAGEPGAPPGLARKLLGRRYDPGRGARVAHRTGLWLATVARNVGGGGGPGAVDQKVYSRIPALPGDLREERRGQGDSRQHSKDERQTRTGTGSGRRRAARREPRWQAVETRTAAINPDAVDRLVLHLTLLLWDLHLAAP